MYFDFEEGKSWFEPDSVLLFSGGLDSLTGVVEELQDPSRKLLLVSHRPVSKIDKPQRDRHGRLLAYVYLPDGRLLNRILIEQGLAVVYRRFEFTMKEDFLVAEKQARQNEAGLWGED